MDKINFQDIQAEHINRYQLVPVPGTTDQFDVVPVRGSVTNEGTPVRALELNQLQENIEDGFISVSGGQLKGDLVPYGTSINLGSSGARWQMVCANTINASNGAFTNLMVNSQGVWHAGNLKVSHADLTLQNGWTGTGHEAQLIGNVVTVRLHGYGSTTAAGTVLCALPENMRPSADTLLVGEAMMRGNTKVRCAQQFIVYPNGNLTIGDGICFDGTTLFTGDAWLAISASYIL